MDPSPPRRITRARAAAKSSGPASTTKTSRVTRKATTAAKPRAARTTSTAAATTKRSSVKRKVRSDDHEDDEDELSHEPQPTEASKRAPKETTQKRGRPRKVQVTRFPDPEPGAESEAEEELPKSELQKSSTSKIVTRARKKQVPRDLSKEEFLKPAGAVRTRKAAKPVRDDDEPAASTAATLRTLSALKSPTTRPARTRVKIPATSSSTAKVRVKKTVTFEEPHKENVELAKTSRTKTAKTTSTGMHAKPVRKTAAVYDKAGSAKGKSIEKTPLSPKKVTQMPVKKPAQNKESTMFADQGVDVSEDELAMPEKIPLKKAPIKPPVAASARKVNEDNDSSTLMNKGSDTKDTSKREDVDHESLLLNGTSGSQKSVGWASLLMRSPVRRLPPPAQPSSLFKDPIRSPPKRVDLGVGRSVVDLEATAAPLKTSLFQSPARRPLFPVKNLNNEETSTPQIPFKSSLLKSPAKRGSAMKYLVRQEPVDPTLTPTPKTSSITTPLAVSVKANCGAIPKKSITEDSFLDVLGEHPSSVASSSKLSATLLRHADPIINGELGVAKVLAHCMKQGTPSVYEKGPDIFEMPDIESKVDSQSLQERETPQDNEAATGNAVPVGSEGKADTMAVDTPENPVFSDRESASVERTTEGYAISYQQPLQTHIGSAFRLRQKDLELYDGMESDSDDELADGSVLQPECFENEDDEPVIHAPKTPTKSGSGPELEPAQCLGFTPLVKKLSAWRSSSPELRTQTAEEAMVKQGAAIEIKSTPSRATFFEDTMSMKPTVEEGTEVAGSESEADAEGEEVAEEMEILWAAQRIGQQTAATGFGPLADAVTEEDVALGAKANEMSIMKLHDKDCAINNQSIQDDTLSEASQEYGDENALPIDPALSGSNSTVHFTPDTPQRPVLVRTLHTFCKTPLKPADDQSLPRAVKQRSAGTMSRLSAWETQHRRRAMRNGSIATCSPSTEKSVCSFKTKDNASSASVAVSSVICTPPSKNDDAAWSTNVTMVGNPRPDVDPGLLKGIVVFVDVRTSEGADASGIFVDLLTQMGAKCVKSWNWNPNAGISSGNRNSIYSNVETTPALTEAAGNPNASCSSQQCHRHQPKEQKLGITHVVYKDGGARTLEKVRESGGVVHCVGVSWVLDCERENKWLNESLYMIDTDFLPTREARRRRRRKSMEPTALANMNGTLISSSSISNVGGTGGSVLPSLREISQSVPTTPAVDGNSVRDGSLKGLGSRRRESTIWIRTPGKKRQTFASAADLDERDGSPNHEQVDQEEDQWNISGFLTPVPITPAPETIHNFAANITPGSVMSDWQTGTMNMESADTTAYRHHDGQHHCITPSGPLALGARTCPPKPQHQFAELGQGILGREKDERVLLRLMAAKRKSLQWAPKVGSPLAKVWD